MNVKGRTSMLVLTRCPGQAVMIGDKIEVRLLPPRFAGEVRVGITAPRTVHVVREELLCQPPRQGPRDRACRKGKDHV
ncbi:carbon storage regulator [Lysobacter sp. ESA13C]|uniref:carbon storage regulator n=1 Tax=Lysobacter sp. ESA13C TaxID=2862676 RepID=UPI0031BA2798